MANLSERFHSLIAHPKTQQAISTAKAAAAKAQATATNPENRAKVTNAVAKAKETVTSPENREKVTQLKDKVAAKVGGHGRAATEPTPTPPAAPTEPAARPATGSETDLVTGSETDLVTGSETDLVTDPETDPPAAGSSRGGPLAG